MKHPSHNINLYGQTQAQKFLTTALDSNTLPHAVIFSGAKGIGKATCAYHLAYSIFNNTGVIGRKLSDSAIHKRIMSGTHGDLFVVENIPADDKVKKSVINVDQIRQLIAFTNKTAIEGGWRIVIVDSLDEMNHQALNALLKRLEEPPKRCLFILIHHYQKDIPATIFSRCQRLIFQPLSCVDMKNVLNDQDIALSHHNIDMIYQFCEGSVVRAGRLIKFKGDHVNDQIQNIIIDLSRGQWQTCLSFINNFLSPSKEYALDDKLYLLGDLLCYNLVQALHVKEPNVIASQYNQIFQHYPHDRIVDIWQKIQNLYRDFENLSFDYYQVAVSSFHYIYQLFNKNADQLALTNHINLGKQ